MVAAASLPVLEGCGRKGAGDGGFTQVRTWRSAVDSCNASERTRRDVIIAEMSLKVAGCKFYACAPACQHAHDVIRQRLKIPVCAGMPARIRIVAEGRAVLKITRVRRRASTHTT